ncbi:hypothetical protein A3K72_01890 [Candidatus Woesearchaeota archaeon RBG_13_36_6]|nr:MAG: hypothetical protein A3K72_01890 [Candidatus Woesearchaeota archaeon RBG_13_36_6]
MYFVFLIVFWVFSHEAAHTAIYKNFGCENITYGFIYTEADCERSDDMGLYPQRELAHSINEIVGYSIMPFIVLINYVLIIKP